ncbi:hypothetical protein [Brucella tritici]|uniref:hypothetical protein n=1 Tax=Brucella tritici TaxID=94626 RepID=UPI001F3EDA67|nr:hypothetical protein [Brucella tritici]
MSTLARLVRVGILTGADLKAKSVSFLQEHFGKSGVWYYNIARGIDHRRVEPDRERKSVGAEDTFAVDIADLGRPNASLSRWWPKYGGGARPMECPRRP